MDGLNGGSKRTDRMDRMDHVNSVHSRRERATSIPSIPSIRGQTWATCVAHGRHACGVACRHAVEGHTRAHFSHGAARRDDSEDAAWCTARQHVCRMGDTRAASCVSVVIRVSLTVRRGATTRRMQHGATQDNKAASVALLRRLGGSPWGPQSHGRVGACRGGGPTDAAASHADVD
jgi:hypothetical protein